MTAKNTIISGVLILISTVVYAQPADTLGRKLAIQEFKDTGLILGVHQFENTFIELGISKTKSGSNGCAYGYYFHGTSLSAEYNPFQNTGGILLTYWTSSPFFTIGANIHSYTDFDNYNFGIKPFAGIGPGNISLTYGYNIELVDHQVRNINNHCISLRYLLSVKKEKAR
jgi:hypothetical protein